MLKITNENGYLIIKGMEIDDGFELKMLKNNTPSGFLKLKVMCLDNVKQYEYQISSMIDFKSYMEKNSLKADDIESYVKCPWIHPLRRRRQRERRPHPGICL